MDRNTYDGEDNPRRGRKMQSARPSTPKPMRPARNRKKPTGNGFGGVHRRRNKHWSW